MECTRGCTGSQSLVETMVNRKVCECNKVISVISILTLYLQRQQSFTVYFCGSSCGPDSGSWVPVCLLCFWISLAKLLSIQKLCIPFLVTSVSIACFVQSLILGNFPPPRWMLCWFISLSQALMEKVLKDVDLFFFLLSFPFLLFLSLFTVTWSSALLLFLFN